MIRSWQEFVERYEKAGGDEEREGLLRYYVKDGAHGGVHDAFAHSYEDDRYSYEERVAKVRFFLTDGQAREYAAYFIKHVWIDVFPTEEEQDLLIRMLRYQKPTSDTPVSAVGELAKLLLDLYFADPLVRWDDHYYNHVARRLARQETGTPWHERPPVKKEEEHKERLKEQYNFEYFRQLRLTLAPHLFETAFRTGKLFGWFDSQHSNHPYNNDTAWVINDMTDDLLPILREMAMRHSVDTWHSMRYSPPAISNLMEAIAWGRAPYLSLLVYRFECILQHKDTLVAHYKK